MSNQGAKRNTVRQADVQPFLKAALFDSYRTAIRERFRRINQGSEIIESKCTEVQSKHEEQGSENEY